MAYEMIKRLQHLSEIDLLSQLGNAVEAKKKQTKNYMKSGSCFLTVRNVTLKHS